MAANDFTPEQLAALERKEQQMEVLRQPSIWNENTQRWEVSPRPTVEEFFNQEQGILPPTPSDPDMER